MWKIALNWATLPQMWTNMVRSKEKVGRMIQKRVLSFQKIHYRIWTRVARVTVGWYNHYSIRTSSYTMGNHKRVIGFLTVLNCSQIKIHSISCLRFSDNAMYSLNCRERGGCIKRASGLLNLEREGKQKSFSLISVFQALNSQEKWSLPHPFSMTLIQLDWV